VTPFTTVLRRNLRLKILSLILALAAWIYVRITIDPLAPFGNEATRRVPLTVSGVRAHTKEQLEVAEVRVNGPFRPSDTIHATVRLDGRGEGTYRLPIEIDSNVAVTSTTPANVLVTVQEEHP